MFKCFDVAAAQKQSQNFPQIEYKISLLKLKSFLFIQQMVSESGA